MAGGGVDGLREARRRTIAPAIVRRAEVRAALQHLARNPDLRLARVVALLLRRRRADSCGMQHALVSRRPGCAGGTSRSSIPRRCRSCRTARSRSAGTRRPATCLRSRRARSSATGSRPARCSPCGDRRAELVAPGVRGAVEPAARGELPLGFGRQLLAGPSRIGFGVAVGDVHDRMPLAPVDASSLGRADAASRRRA